MVALKASAFKFWIFIGLELLSKNGFHSMGVVTSFPVVFVMQFFPAYAPELDR
jgi:hypothetical protein